MLADETVVRTPISRFIYFPYEIVTISSKTTLNFKYIIILKTRKIMHFTLSRPSTTFLIRNVHKNKFTSIYTKPRSIYGFCIRFTHNILSMSILRYASAVIRFPVSNKSFFEYVCVGFTIESSQSKKHAFVNFYANA